MSGLFDEAVKEVEAEKREFKEDERVIEAATPGPWTNKKPQRGGDGWPTGVAIAGTGGGGGVFANPPGGTHPAADARFIARARTRWPAANDARKRALKNASEQLARADNLQARLFALQEAVADHLDQFPAEGKPPTVIETKALRVALRASMGEG